MVQQADAKFKSLGTTQSPIPWDDAKSNPESRMWGTTQSPIPDLSDTESNLLKKKNEDGGSSPESWILGDETVGGT